MRRDDGVATVWAASVVAALMVVVTALYGIGVVVLVRQRAAAAADLAALAAAGAAVEGAGAACAKAGAVAAKMRVELAGCRLDRWDALIETRTALPGPLGRLPPASGRARAGPVDSSS
ncbi:flp pilus-assembly TadE/G-like family protein [Saccharothrix sp. AJ9571]|nr:flp pilus-assembly TadE/G-like family protein [Saccharothrix sp. AJ9571]